MNLRRADVVAIGTRDSAGWAALDWMAAGLSLLITRKLDAAGEISLGRRGLEAVAALVGQRATWGDGSPFDIEPLVTLLIDEGRLEYDKVRQVLRDPQHVARQEAALTAWGLARPSRLPSASPAAIAKREQRARRRAELQATADRQLTLPARRRTVDIEDTFGTCPDVRDMSTDDVAAATRSPADLATLWELPPLDMSADAAPPSLSSISDLPKEKKEKARTPAVSLDADHVPPEFALVAAELRPDLHDGIVGRSWRKFAGRMNRKGWRSLSKVLDAWSSWIDRELAPTTPPPPPEAPAPPPPASEVRPRLASPAPRTFGDLDQAAQLAAREASAKLAAGLFARAS